jgi:hypothetical protein
MKCGRPCAKREERQHDRGHALPPRVTNSHSGRRRHERERDHQPSTRPPRHAATRPRRRTGRNRRQSPRGQSDSLAAESADIEALVVFPALRRAYSDGFADPQSMAPEELAEVESAPPGRMLEALRERQPPIDDVAAATSWWSAFERNSAHDALEEDWDDERHLMEPDQPYRAPAKVGRNEPCPCGSGQKFKKCCGR